VTEIDALYGRFQDLQRYVGWAQEDAAALAALRDPLEPGFPALIDDFYAEIDRHEGARQVITGGDEQVTRLKGTLLTWLGDLFSAARDRDYVARRWRVGVRHVEIGLAQVYTNAALSRLRAGLVRALDELHPRPPAAAARALQKALDLDLALIEHAYESEHTRHREQAERLAAIGQVASGVAHELRQPLNVIETSSYFLRNAPNASEAKKAEHLERIGRQVAIANAAITAIADFARLPVPKAEPVSVAEWIDLGLREQALPTSVEVRVECPPHVPPILGDAAQLAIVLRNLIRNARDAMPEGGALTIRAAQENGEVRVTVADTGIGIDETQIFRITEPLFTTKARGLGLGLAITRSIVEKHGGHLAAESTLGKGTTFTVRLPSTAPHPRSDEGISDE
jgi:signal transduction histidine kinase